MIVISLECLSCSHGFPGGFLLWARSFGFTDPVGLPDPHWCQGVLQVLEEETQALARRTANEKSQHFASVVEDSWATGGSLPFVLELRMNVAVRLAPQQWLPCGKAC